MTLLRTKLHRPPPPRDLVHRARLVERLNRGLSGPLTLVCAAAGFGKSTLVSSWIENLGAEGEPGAPTTPTAWLSLDEQDSDLVVFLRYFVAALRTLYPEACAEILALLRVPQPPSSAHLATTLINELALLPGPCILVLDDYSALQGEAVPDLLNAMVRHWPQPLHLVLISRHDPPLPLSSLRAKGMITEIRSRDLRFTAEETAAYVSRVLPAPLSSPAMTLLEQHMEGWIAGLHLACLSLRQVDDADAALASLANTNAQTADYLMDEVLSHQPPALQSFLLKTAILDRFCAPLCGAVVANEDPAWPVQACLDRIERNNLFIISLDDRREWYRYHPVFQDLLKQRLMAETEPDQIGELHRRSAAWHAAHGLLEDAVSHALAAGDLDLAAQLVEQATRDVLNREDRSTLERWLRLLPEELIQRRPGLLMIEAWTLEFSWQLGAQVKVLDQIEALIAEDGAGTLNRDGLPLWRGQVLVLRGQEAYFRNQAAQAVAFCQQALALLPPTWTYCRAGAMLYLGVAMYTSGQGHDAERLLLDQYESLGDKTSGYALRHLLPLCFNYLSAGQLEQAGQTAQLMAQQAAQTDLATLQCWARHFQGAVHYHRNELDAACRHFGAVVDHRYRASAIAARASIMGLVLTHRALGDYAAAHEMVELLGRYEVEQRGTRGDRTYSLGARLLLMQGDVAGAARWADAFTAPLGDQPLLWLEEPHLTQARILLARGAAADVQAALHILDALCAVAERTFNVRFQIEIQALRSLALDAQGRAGVALATLGRAVELAQPGGFVRVFVELGARMWALLSRLAVHSPAPEAVHSLLAAFPEQQREVAAGQPQTMIRGYHPALVEPLTPRELQILAYLREPFSPKEIARKLDVSYATVKRHTSNLYSKLGVRTRWDAVATAETLGILAPR